MSKKEIEDSFRIYVYLFLIPFLLFSILGFLIDFIFNSFIPLYIGLFLGLSWAGLSVSFFYIRKKEENYMIWESRNEL